MTLRLFILAFSTWTFASWAQSDPTSLLLLRNGAKAPEKLELDSGRYTIRPAEQKGTVGLTESRPKVSERRTTTTAAEAQPPTATTAAPVAPNQPASVSPAEAPAGTPPVTSQVKDLVLGGSPESIDSYRDQLHPNDIRRNMVEISLAPVYLYTDSSSNYWFQKYSAGGPGFLVAAQIWMTPFFGVATTFLNSLDASISAAPDTSDRIRLEEEWFDVGLRWRKFFKVARYSPVMTFGLDYSETRFRVPPDSDKRTGSRTVGAKLSLELSNPVSHYLAWQFGGFIIPSATHKEIPTASTVDLGGRARSTVAGLWVGAVHGSDRHSQMFWRLQHTVERDLYDGTASPADPLTGTAPKGVSVTTGTTFVIMGYRWGN